MAPCLLATAVLCLMVELAAAAGAVVGVDGGGEACQAVLGLPLKVRLNNGVTVSRIGFGTAGLGHATEESVGLALAAGYRHIDTAQAQEWYREDAVGRAIQRTIFPEPTEPASLKAGLGEFGEGGGGVAPTVPPKVALSREDIFVTTKIHPRDFGADRMGAMVGASNRNLQGVDLLLLHSPNCWPGSCPENPTPWQDAWREMENLYSEGEVRAIGVSNFPEGLLRELLGMATIVPAAVQNWMDPFHQDKGVRALCAERGIAYMAYSTLGGQWAYRPSSSSSPNPISTDPTLGGIASAHGTSVQAVALSWALQSGAMILPRSSSPDRIRGNLRIFIDIEAFSSLRDESGNGMEQACGTGRAGGSDLRVFLTDKELDAIDLLDNTIGG